MATLSGNKIKDTYQSLVKFSDNGNITTSAKQLTDGFGNNSPMFVSTTQVGIGVTPESGLNLHVFGDAKIGSNLTVIGNLVVEGSTTTVGTDTLTVKDPLIVLANNNTSTDAVDIGFYGKYTPSGTTLYSGLFREALTGKYRLFKGLEVEPTTTVNTSGTGYTKADLVIGNLETTQIDLQDNQKIRIGVSQDLEIYHNATNSFIDNDTGSLYIRNNAIDESINIQCDANGSLANYITAEGLTGEVTLYHNGSTKLVTKSNGIAVTGIISNLTDPSAAQDAATKNYVDTQISANNELSEVLANGNTTGGTDIAVSAGDDITFTDTSKSIYGTDGELEIHHSGTNSYITEDGTGALYLQGTYMYLTKSDGSQNYIELDLDGATDSRVKLNYGGATKLTTTSTGVSITGNINLGDNNKILLGDSDDVEMYFDGATQFGIINDTVGGGIFLRSNSFAFTNGTNEFYSMSSTTHQLKSSGTTRLTVNSTGIDVNGNINIGDNEKIIFGDGGDIEMFFNGSTFVIDDTVEVFGFDIDTNLIRFRGTDLYTEISNAQHTFWTNGTERFKINTTEVKVSHQLNVTGDLIVDTDTLFVDVSTDSVGIGLTNPADYSADELVISVPDDSGMTLVSAATDTAYITFADGTTAAAQSNFISHDHSTDTLTIFSQAKVSIGILEAEVAYFTDTAFFVDKSTTIDDTLTVNGNVGIGISPNQNLHIFKSDATALIQASNTSGIAQLQFFPRDASNVAHLQSIKGVDSSLTFLTGGNSGNSYVPTERMHIDSSGNVGIGTDSPDLGAISGTRVLTIASPESERWGILELAGNRTYGGNQVGEIKFISTDATNNGTLVSLTATNDPSATGTGGDLKFNTRPNGGSLTERMRIDSSGNSTFSGSSGAISGTGSVYINNGDDAFALVINNTGTSSQNDRGVFDARVGGDSVLRINNSGNVGIGTTSPDANLQVVGAGQDQIRFGTSTSVYTDLWMGTGYTVIDSIGGSAGGFDFRDDGTSRMFIDSSGNVGIGTTDPQRALDVVSTTDGIPAIRITRNGDSTQWMEIQAGGANTSFISRTAAAHSQFQFISDVGGSQTTRMIINQSGNVGIGETSPTQLLHIKATSAGNNGITLQSTNVSGNSQVRFLNTSGTERAAITYVNSVDAVYHYTTGGGNLLNLVGANVGIGTDSPRVQNEIYGTGQLTSAISDSGNTGGTLSLSSNQNAFNAGGCLLFGAVNDSGNTKPQASIKSLLQNGVLQGVGDLAFSTRASTSDTALTERMRITSGGNIEQGTIGTTASAYYYFNSTTSGDTGIIFRDNASTNSGFLTYNHSIDAMKFGAGGSERMRIGSAGDVLISTDTGSGLATGISVNAGISLQGGVIASQVNNNSNQYWSKATGYTSGDFSAHFVNNVYVGGISTNGSTTSYATSSDYRLKEDLQDFKGLDMVSKIPVYDFKWKSDESRSYGVMAHELQEVLPDAVSGEKDAERMQGVDYSKIVPLLVKSIQELKAEVELLKTQINK